MSRRLTAAGADVRYAYRVVRPARDSAGIGLYSRFPIVTSDVRMIGSRLGIEAQLDVEGRAVRLLIVHPFPPVLGGKRGAAWKASLEAVGDLATSRGPPTLVVGDFNASRWHPPFRRLLARGLRDVHEWLHRGFSTSWPMDWRIPPFVRLDHALVGPGMVPVRVDDVAVPGSDHRGYVAEVAISP